MWIQWPESLLLLLLAVGVLHAARACAGALGEGLTGIARIAKQAAGLCGQVTGVDTEYLIPWDFPI